jgi:hypothetical protein
LALLETYGGGERIIRIAERKWKRPVGRLHVRAIDASTGKLTAFRAHGTETGGKFYAPHDAYALISMTGRRCFLSRGEFTVELPPGELTIEAVKGFEYEPVRQRAAVKPGQTTELTLVLKRIATLPAQGWYSGSTHVHMNYGGNLRNTPERLAWMAASEDLHIVSALIANMDNRIFDWQYFRLGGGEYPLSGGPPGVKVLFAEEYRPPFPGHVFMIGMRDHLISPFVTGYEGTAIESLYPSNTDMFRKARAQGAIGGYVHPFGESDPLESGLGAKHFPVDAALGTVDCLEWSNAIRAQHRVWHRMLNNDFSIVPVGGEDSITDLHNRKLIGNIRTYAYLGQDFRVEAWVEAIRKGRTFFSTGPLLEFRINDQIPGGRLRLPAGGGKVTISGSVRSVAPLSKLTLYHRGGAFKQIPLNPDGKGARFTETIAVEHSDWFSITAEGPRYPALDTEFPLATTNAIRVYVGEEKIRDRDSAEYFIRWIDKLKVMTGQWPWWRSQAEKDHIYSEYEQARRVYERLAEEADR